ncbi:MAG: MazG nucleotide pyrophosphohydrolase domain-containing protein, partial [Candidatus Brocadiales bacterium]
MSADKYFRDLVELMRKLRDEGGCPWDKEQTHETLKPYLVEETYEVIDAIDSGEAARLKEELG